MGERLTRRDIERMQEEIDHRKLVVRHQLLEDVKEARAQGDLSENFEYYAAKKAKNQNESRIRYLERVIKTAIIVEDTSAEDEVGLNDKVRVMIEDENEEEEYKLVTGVRSNPGKGLVSIDSPIGKAMKGKKVGDRCYVEIAPGDGYYIQILSIDKTDDEEDQMRKY